MTDELHPGERTTLLQEQKKKKKKEKKRTATLRGCATFVHILIFPFPIFPVFVCSILNLPVNFAPRVLSFPLLSRKSEDPGKEVNTSQFVSKRSLGYIKDLLVFSSFFVCLLV